MTRVTMERRGDRYTITVRGHATTEGPSGSRRSLASDPPPADGARVCAAVSCLCCALAGWLEGGGAERGTLALAPGEAEFRFSGGERARGAFELASTAFFQLQNTAPGRVRAERRDHCM